MEALFAQDDATRLSVVEQLRGLRMIAEDFEISKSDLGGVIAQGGLGVGPQVDSKQVRMVGVIGKVPIEIAAIFGDFCERIDEVFTGYGFRWFLGCVCLIPVMI